jgi:hypothetical protein
MGMGMGTVAARGDEHGDVMGLHLHEHAQALLLAPFEVERALDPKACRGLDPWRCDGDVIWRKASTGMG